MCVCVCVHFYCSFFLSSSPFSCSLVVCAYKMYSMCQAFQKIANRCAKLKFDMTETLANSSSFFPSSSSLLLLSSSFELFLSLSLSFIFFDIILPYFSSPSLCFTCYCYNYYYCCCSCCCYLWWHFYAVVAIHFI